MLLAAGGTFAVTMGARQSMGLFLNTLNTSTGLGLASISLAFAFGQLWWGLTQPFAGMVADRYGAGRVIVAGVLLVALGTAIVPLMTTTAGLILAIGVLAAGGAGMAGVSVLMAATTRLVSPERRGMATGLVNAGGSFGQFVFAPIAQGVDGGRGLGRARCRAWRSCRCWRCRRPGSCAGTRPRAAAPGTQKPETTREAIRPRAARSELPVARRRLLRLRLSRRLHRHAPAGRGRRVRAAAFRRRLGAGDRRPVQHRRQLRDRLGDRAAGA